MTPEQQYKEGVFNKLKDIAESYRGTNGAMHLNVEDASILAEYSGEEVKSSTKFNSRRFVQLVDQSRREAVRQELEAVQQPVIVQASNHPQPAKSQKQVEDEDDRGKHPQQLQPSKAKQQDDDDDDRGKKGRHIHVK